ncbi:MAG: MATE family efflux transporter [Bacteroidaceae bacterium]|nr:MATE family efflux transporter [Bacteroidaceae bacterium]
MKQTNNTSLELEQKSVGRLLWQYALPSIIAMTASSLYNTVDSIFIGQCVGPLAISGLAITFPFMNLSAAFGAAIGVGASSYLSMKLGQHDYSTARTVLGNTTTLNIIIGIVFGALSLLFLDPILYFFGASPDTISYAREYMIWILLGNTFTHLYFGMNALLRAASKPKMAMYATIFTVVLNTILDPILIYVLDMGIQGAAIATVVSQFLAMCWQFKQFFNKNEILHLERGTYKPRLDIVKNIISIGIAPFSLNVCACIVVIFINQGLSTYGGDLEVGAYGIGNKVVFIFVMFCMGINQGMQPIVGYNYGAGKMDRVKKALYLSMAVASAITFTGFLFAMIIPEPICRLFTNDEALLVRAAYALRINMSLFFCVGFQMVIGNFFQSIGKAKLSIFLSLSRQMIFLLPMLILLPKIFGLDGVWYSLPASDLISAFVALIIFTIYQKKHLNKQLI